MSLLRSAPKKPAKDPDNRIVSTPTGKDNALPTWPNGTKLKPTVNCPCGSVGTAPHTHK